MASNKGTQFKIAKSECCMTDWKLRFDTEKHDLDIVCDKCGKRLDSILVVAKPAAPRFVVLVDD